MKEIKLKKVLSIDMDFIMGPCIQLYNDMVAGYQNEYDVWERVRKERDIEPHLRYDENKLAFIFDIFTKGIMDADKDKIMFARNHDSILDLLCTEEGKQYVYDIVNIDHHHDIGYSFDNFREVENFDFASLNNWVWYLNKHNRLRTYTWVRNANSGELGKPTEDFKVDFIYEPTEDYRHPKFFEEKYDYVFVCCSPEWFPEKFVHLFLIMRQIAFNLKGMEYDIRTDRYCIGEKSKPYEVLDI